MEIELDVKDLIDVYEAEVKERSSTNSYAPALLLGYRIIKRLRDEIDSLQASINNERHRVSLRDKEIAQLRVQKEAVERRLDQYVPLMKVDFPDASWQSVGRNGVLANLGIVVGPPSDPLEQVSPDE